MLVFLRMCVFIFIALTPLINALEHVERACPINVSPDVWQMLNSYFLPDDHPIRKKLDMVCSSTDLLENEESLKKAGFKMTGAKGYSKTMILKHNKLKKYLIKAFTDDQPQVVDWEIWVRRIDGASVIRSAIDRLGFQKIFKVPQKWIYQVTRSGENFDQKNFILVVEDMEIYDQRGNRIMWANAGYASKEKLNALYILLKEVGLKDSIYIDNIPFSLDEKIAFVDTEHFHKWPVQYQRLTPVLSKKMQDYWTNLTVSGF